MSMMHIKYPAKRGYFTWDELGCLARAIGFQQDMFFSHIPEEYTSVEPGVSLEGLLHMVEVQKYFNQVVDRSVNIHTDRWNLSVIKKALPLLSNKILTFSELQQVRVSYQVYETGDTKGMPIEITLLQRALKMSNRMISPMKMMHRIKHMRHKFEEKDRMQLHEFLDLLLWCEMYQGTKVGPAEMNVTKEDTGLLQMEDFADVLAHHDQRMANQMDEKFIEQEFKFSKERHGSKALPKDEVPVDPDVRIKQVAYHQSQYRFLQHEIEQSNTRVSNAFTGKIRGRPITAPDLTMHQAVDPSAYVSTLDPKPPSVMQAVGHLFKSTSRPTTREETMLSAPRPKVMEYTQPLPPVQSNFGDVEDTEKLKEALKFQMETIGMKYHQLVEEDIDFMMPGFRERQANRRKKEESNRPLPPPKQKPKKEQRPSEDYLQQLAFPKLYRSLPPPSHAKNCDARHRGWHKTRVRKGPHHVLSTPYFDKSPNGVLLNKLRLASQTELGREDFIYRYTKPERLVPDHPRPEVLAERFPRSKTMPAIHLEKSNSAHTHSSGDRISGEAPPAQPETAGGNRLTAQALSVHGPPAAAPSGNAPSSHKAPGPPGPSGPPGDSGSSEIDWEDFKMYAGGEAPGAEGAETGEKPPAAAPPADLEEKYKLIETYTQKGLDGYQKGKIMGRLNVLEQIREGEERDEDGEERRQSLPGGSREARTAPESGTRPPLGRTATAPELSIARPLTESTPRPQTETAPRPVTESARIVLSSNNKLVEETPRGGRPGAKSSATTPMDWVVVPAATAARPSSMASSRGASSPRKSVKSSTSGDERAVNIVSPDMTSSFIERVPKSRDPEMNKMITDILKKDYTEQINAQKNTRTGYRRLGRRMEGVVSRDLYGKLMHGLPSANTELHMQRSNTVI